MDAREFLSAVVTTPVGHFNLAVWNGSSWRELWYKWPDDIDEIVSASNQLAQNQHLNVYFSSYLFSEPHALKQNVLPTRTIQADLDNADISTLEIPASVLVCTSHSRHQGFWLLDRVLNLTDHEHVSKKLTYSIELCDRSGWPLGRRVRVPDTINYKYEVPQKVFVHSHGLMKYDPNVLEMLPAITLNGTADLLEQWVNYPTLTSPSIGPQELLFSIKDNLPPRVFNNYNTAANDRSEALWALMCAGFRAGLTREEVFYLAQHSANNKFATLKYNGDRELAKDVLRASDSVALDQTDVRRLIAEARTMPGTGPERKQYMAELIIRTLRDNGTFLTTTDDIPWYVRDGQPIEITRRSERLSHILDLEFGLNGTEGEHHFVMSAICSHASTIPANTINSSMSNYNPITKQMLLHAGYACSTYFYNGLTARVQNGSNGVVFPWILGVEQFKLVNNPAPDWAEFLFGKSIDNALELPRPYTLALLKVWLLFLLFRNSAPTRPILAIFGQIGAGKSFLFKKVFSLLYGSQKHIGGVTSMDDYDHSVATDSLVVLDNADTWEKWLPDRLAQSISAIDITKRRLFTDGETYIQHRNAMIGLTAHSPKFIREDIADRLLIVNLARIDDTERISEIEMLTPVLENRDQLWSAIALDIQCVLNTPLPLGSDAPSLRIEDFAYLGYWIATALGCQTEFKAAINHTVKRQKMLSLEEDSLLVDALVKYTEKPRDYVATSTLWASFELQPGLDVVALRRIYKNAAVLAQKLWTLQDALKQMFVIESRVDPRLGVKQWRINKRSEDT